MVNLFDFARQAQGGHGFETLSRQFGLEPSTAQRAVEALLPAFSLALQRSLADPATFASLMGLVGSGQFTRFFETGAASRDVAGSPDKVLAQLFGSREVADAVAAQAAPMAGIAAQLLQRMMPVIAATLVGGMSRYASVEGFADLLRDWSDAIKSTQRGAARPASSGADPWSAWADVMRSLTGGVAPPPPPKADPMQAWTGLMNAAFNHAAPSPSPTKPSPVPANPFPVDEVTRMFETGREVQAQQLAGVQSLLDGFWSAAPKTR